MAENDNIQLLPLVPLKNSVLFPNLLMPLSVGRAASLAAVEAALATEEKQEPCSRRPPAVVRRPAPVVV